MILILSTPTETLLNEIGDKQFTWENIAVTYAIALREPHSTDWPRVNAAIIERWSKTRLVKIKERAWQIFEGKVRP